MICVECRNGRHKKCAWPASCPCQHLAAGTKIAVASGGEKEKSDGDK